jgi:hypothetical protein
MTRKLALLAPCVLVVALAFSAALVAQGRQGNPPLGEIGAIGGGAKRAPAPTGPVPRLPDGSVDLSGLWVGGGPVQDIEKEGGLKPGTLESLMTPEAKRIFASRKPEDSH